MSDLGAQLRVSRARQADLRDQLVATASAMAATKVEEARAQGYKSGAADADKRNRREQRAAGLQLNENLTYRAGGEHSFFLDAARAVRLSDKAAVDRLARHQREMDVELPKRREARARAASAAYEREFASSIRDRETLSRMTAAGLATFEATQRESRAVSRTPGQLGYLVPPIYLLDRFVEFAREASPFASLWTNLPLPAGTDSINVPRIAVATATGPQQDTGPAGTRDIGDSLVSAPVRTVAGIADVSRQWFEQGQGSAGFGVDDVVWADLTADLAQNVDGHCLVGAGSPLGQLLGVFPQGAISASGGIVVADSNNAASQTWTSASSGASLHVQLAQTASLLRRLRVRSDGLYWVWHPWVWSLYTAAVDSQNRPLVIAQDLDGLPPGVVGFYQNVPVVADANIPTTFGGTTAPYIGTITNGAYAAVPGTGGTPNYTPMLIARPKDLYLFQGDIKMQVLHEAIAGTMQVRFMLRCYLALLPNRFVAAAATGSNVSAGGNVAHATLTWNVTNSLLQLSGSGY